MINNNSNFPSSSPATTDGVYSVVSLPELKRLQEVFTQVENNTAEIAEALFDYLLDIADMSVVDGEIPLPKDTSIVGYIKALNKLFKLSRRKTKTSFIVINRKLVKNLDRKTYHFCMCIDGGFSLDILCEIVNQENNIRTPKASPIKITVIKFAPDLNLGESKS